MRIRYTDLAPTRRDVREQQLLGTSGYVNPYGYAPPSNRPVSLRALA